MLLVVLQKPKPPELDITGQGAPSFDLMRPTVSDVGNTEVEPRRVAERATGFDVALITSLSFVMGYFGGKGAGKGWNRFCFAVTGSELRSLLQSERLFVAITNTRVPVAYAHTPVSDYCRTYERYVEEMVTHAVVPWETTGQLRRSLVTDLAVFHDKPCPDPQFKLLDPAEPVVAIAPVPVWYREGKLSLSITSKYSLGLEMAFPRVVSFDREEHRVYHGTEAYPNRQLFEELTKAIRATTTQCRITSADKVHRVRLYVSQEMKRLMKGHAGLAALGLSVVQ